jgi:hypothetical protein
MLRAGVSSLRQHAAGDRSNLLLNDVDRSGGVDHVRLARGIGRFSEKPVTQSLLELFALQFHAIQFAREAPACVLWGDVEHKDAVRLDAGRAYLAGPLDLVYVEPARIALVDDVGEDEPIGDDDFAGLQGGPNALFDKLSARRHVEEHLRATVNVPICTARQQDLSDTIAQGRTTRIAARKYVVTFVAKPITE